MVGASDGATGAAGSRTVKVDPAYGAKKGVAGAADTSLSVPVSAFAKGSVASPEDAGWAGKLPKNQKCG